jgi:hypothetical protein
MVSKMNINKNIEISFEFAEYYYDKHIPRSFSVWSDNRDNDEKSIKFWQSLVLTSAYTEEFISEKSDRCWDWNLISKRKNLSSEFIRQHYDNFIPTICFGYTFVEIGEYYDKSISFDDIFDKFILENKDENKVLIHYFDLEYYLSKFGEKSLEEFIKKYINYIQFNYIKSSNKLDINNIIDRLLFLYGSDRDLQNMNIYNLPRELYKKYKHKLPKNFKITNILEITLEEILNCDEKLDIEDYDFYTKNKLTESELTYIIDKDLVTSIIEENMNNKYYLNWSALKFNTNISKLFIDMTYWNPKYSWRKVGGVYSNRKYYTMENYKIKNDIPLKYLRGIDANLLSKHIDFYRNNINSEMITTLTDEMAEILIQNRLDIVNLFENLIHSLSIEFVWKYIDIFIESSYTFIPKTNEEAIKYFPFCKHFDNVDIFNAESNELVYIFGKFIPIEKVMDLLDKQNGEIGELPRDVLEMILIELNKIQNL